MSRPPDSGKPVPFRPAAKSRRMRGFEPAAGLLREPIRKAGESRGFAITRLLTHWPEIAGRDLAGLCRPVKVSYGQGGLGATLSVLASGAAAPLVQMQLPMLKERVNACYGYAAIARIKVTQTSAQGFADAQTAFTGPSNIATPSPQTLLKARQVVDTLTDGVGDSSLKSALERLAENVLTRQKGTGPKPVIE